MIFDVGAMAAGAIPAGIYTTSSPAECAYILNHSEAPVLLVENEAAVAEDRRGAGTSCPTCGTS